MRLRSWAGVGVAVACACSSPAPLASEGYRYLNDQSFRRAELQSSLVNPGNAYSKLRLAHYAGGDARWDALPEWNPRVEHVLPADLDDGTAARTSLSSAAAALPTTASVEDDAAMRSLGESAFFSYPTQLAAYAASSLATRAAASGVGLWIDAARNQVGGLVRAELADGSAAIALSCASCHAAQGASGLIVGVGSDQLDLGRMIAAGGGGAGGAPSTLLAWGRGRVDVTTADGTAPQRIPDLRPTRWLSYLHQEATLTQKDRAALAIRLETLIVTSHGEALRPPRLLVWAMAVYLWSLADALPSSAPATASGQRGAAVFSAQCASCHAPPGLTGAPVVLAVVGTDPAIGEAPDRGTGTYRVPSLRGVGTRGLLLHDASLPSLDALLDPTRTDATFAGGTRGTGAIPGHVYGLSLADGDRADLIAYMRAL